MTLTIPLTKGYSAIVDDEDADLAASKWCAQVGGTGIVYAARARWELGKRSYVYMHRVILGRMLAIVLIPRQLVDHVNGNGLINTRINLRLATPAQNQHNCIHFRDNTSGFRGVSWFKGRDRWYVRLKLDGKTIRLGYFRDFDDAVQARLAGELKYYGEFAPRIHDGDLAGAEASADRYLLSEEKVKR